MPNEFSISVENVVCSGGVWGEGMNEDSRRAFLSRLLAGTGAVVAFGALPDFSLAYDHAAAQVNGAENKLVFFTPEEAEQMEAVCEQIIPSDDGPGAREAGAIYFVDYAVSQTEPHLQPIFRSGLKELAAACAPDKFNELGTSQQIVVLKKLEQTEFFAHARQYTILGFLGDPARHGNRDQVGWKYIGFENPGMFTHPFGYYDAEFLSEKKRSQ
ncbi:MAG: gluconate 2-dehydrogenase gamma chain [Acidobacteriaceae bacterium]|jgi:gluconate 2-dehydrogenase gamma chain|nr:gluconate 2-dehydrogenase gamma chain [Acidobacteriaceae bacterium]